MESGESELGNDREHKMISRLRNMMIYLPFVYYYIGSAGLAVYLLAGRIMFGRLSYLKIIYGLSFAMYSVYLLSVNGIGDGLIVLRFFWGFLLFYLIFASRVQIDVDKLLIVLSALTILEAVLVNTVISAEILPNYPVAGAMGHFTEVNLGEYQRPYSFGGNPGVTSVVLVALLAVSKARFWGKALAVGAICACYSGSGFMVLFLYLILISGFFSFLVLVPTISWIVYSGILSHLSLTYVAWLIDFKMNQIASELPMDSLLMGIPLNLGVDGLGGDFAFLSFFNFSGLAGVFLLITAIITNLNKRNILPILIMAAGSVEYGAIFHLPGQLMLGYFLNLKTRIQPGSAPHSLAKSSEAPRN